VKRGVEEEILRGVRWGKDRRCREGRGGGGGREREDRGEGRGGEKQGR